MASNNDKHVRPESSDRRPRGNSFVYIGTVVLLVITVVAFVFVPAMGGMGGSGGELNFGSWNGKPIAFAQGGYRITSYNVCYTKLLRRRSAMATRSGR